ncbi:MAG: SIR2 family protein [Methanolobus sp.]|nr:SIR2 family protein [Methanolobus sp.]
MNPNHLSRLSNSIANNRCVLFAGSGLTASSGGTTWEGLIDYLFEKFNYTGLLDPKEDNGFEIFQDLFIKNDPELIYNEVRDRLKDAIIPPQCSNLTTLPWFTVFTTNYDLALERSLRENQHRQLKTVVNGKEFALTGIPNELLYVKLMGSLDILYGQEGSMVLTDGDLTSAKENRPFIFNLLASHAANLSFLFVGYSFKDGIFKDVVNKLIQLLGMPKNTYYAVFRNKPSPKEEDWLKTRGIEIIISDLSSLTEELTNKIKIHDPNDFSMKRIPIGNDIIPIDSKNIGNFLSLHNPVLFEDMEKDVSPDDFFKGNVESFKPFSLNWHYPRIEKEKIFEKILRENTKIPTNIFVVEGRPGSGRSFLIMDVVYSLITRHRILALKIEQNSFNPFPRMDELGTFIEEVERACQGIQVDKPNGILFWAEFELEDEAISKFNSLTSNCNYPVYLIYERNKNYFHEDSLFNSLNKIIINVDIELTEKQKNELKDYLVDVFSKHPFGELTNEEAYGIVDDEKTFLPIMYRAIDPAKRSIHTIVQEELKNISNPMVKAVVLACAYPTSLDIEFPLSSLRKVISKQFSKTVEYAQMFEIEDEAFVFLKKSEDIRTNYYFSIYHSIIAQYLIQKMDSKDVDDLLMDIVNTIDITIPIEADFVGNLLVNKGTKLKGEFKPITSNGLENAFLQLIKRQPARPLLHHLAIYYSNKDKNHDKIMPLLTQALEKPNPLFALEERKENVLSTLARMKWNQKKDYLMSQPRNNIEMQEIIDLLILARKNVEFNPHTYVIHARILKEFASSKTAGEKTALINESLELLADGLELCNSKDKDCEKLRDAQIELLEGLDLSQEIENAEILLKNKKDGSGFYTLARVKYDYKQDIVEATKMLEKALGAVKCPSGAIALKIEIMLQNNYPDYGELIKLVNDLSTHTSYNDTWKSVYNKAVVYAINGDFEDSNNCFKLAGMKSPSGIQREVGHFVMENGRRKTFSGTIGRVFTRNEGRIYSHNFDKWKWDIFFNPLHQKMKDKLDKGYHVSFELGFSLRGPVAFDVRPYGSPSF